MGTAVAVVAVGSALQVVLCAWGALWVELFLVLPSFLGMVLAWYALDHAHAVEARLATRRTELRIDVPEHSVVVVQHRSSGPAMLSTPVGKVSCS